MWRYRNRADNCKILVFTLKGVSVEYLCLFLQVKCAKLSCMFGFFYLPKSVACRSPPPTDSKI